MSLKKKINIRLKSVNLQQKIGERWWIRNTKEAAGLLLGKKQRFALAVWGSTWRLWSVALGLCLPQLRLLVGRPMVGGTKPCLRNFSGFWKSENTVKRLLWFSKAHWECHHLSDWILLEDPLKILRWGFPSSHTKRLRLLSVGESHF